MKTQIISAQSHDNKETKSDKTPLVLFNKQEIAVLNRVKPSTEGVTRIKKLKHLFHGTLVG
ncbi:MAG: hypothetical protein OEZ36_14360 [Spirochaetota bacterium]|nr:hypothetical protein [Spirochaetota bacterium]